MEKQVMKKYGAEFLGSFWLILCGCGAAVLSVDFPKGGIGTLGISLAFGFSLLTMASTLGQVSGGHFNPAVSVGLWAAGRFPARELPAYIGAQVIGGLVAGAVLYFIATAGPTFDPSAGFASNGYGMRSPGHYTLGAAFVTEVIMTLFFVIVVLGATDERAPKAFAPVAIGLSLALVHLVSIPITNTSVNPARSTGVAFFAGGGAVEQLWLFWLAPIVGALLAATAYRVVATGAASRPED